MLIAGRWQLCPDGVTRPLLAAALPAAGGQLFDTDFLVDSGADATVLCRQTLDAVQQASPPGGGATLAGVGGQVGCVVVQTTLHFTCEDGTVIRVHGSFAAFLAPDASDVDILGRDVLNNFDVILSYPRREVLLLAPNHSYQVVTS
jgi:hypothetical protein